MNSKQKLLLLFGAKKKAWSVAFNGTNTVIAAGSDASVDNLPLGNVTYEGYFLSETLGGNNVGRLFDKFSVTGIGIFWSTTNIRVSINNSVADVPILGQATDKLWHHWVVSFSGADDRKIKVFLDGALLVTSNAVTMTGYDDSALNLSIGNNNAADRPFDGNIGWIRISNSLRYTTAFTPQSRFDYPAADANTVRLFKLNEAIGTTITDYSANAQNATLANGIWVKA
jgi:hypothetical protein